MPFFGEVFSSEVIKKPVLDPKGEELGKVKDLVIIKGDPLPVVSALVIEKRKKLFWLSWQDVSIFNKKIISSKVFGEDLRPYELNEDDLLILRDILDKQIVDANGAKVVRVNDIRLEGFLGEAVLIGVDVGVRGILRRLGIERGSESFLGLLNTRLPYNLISWNYIQPLRPKLNAITLTVPRQMLSELHPADIADLISQVSRDEGAQLFKGLDIETAAEALSELEPDIQADIINAMDTEKAADIIEEMQPDEAADILSDLPTEKAKALLESIEKEDAEDIQELLGHEEDTAGGLMTNKYIAYPPETVVKDALERLKIDAKDVEIVYYVYILDPDEKLIGIITLREMLFAEPECTMADIMETNLKTVSPQEDQMVVAELISKYNLLALPVTDQNGCMLGVITVDDVVDILLPSASRRRRRKG